MHANFYPRMATLPFIIWLPRINFLDMCNYAFLLTRSISYTRIIPLQGLLDLGWLDGSVGKGIQFVASSPLKSVTNLLIGAGSPVAQWLPLKSNVVALDSKFPKHILWETHWNTMTRVLQSFPPVCPRNVANFIFLNGENSQLSFRQDCNSRRASASSQGPQSLQTANLRFLPNPPIQHPVKCFLSCYFPK